MFEAKVAFSNINVNTLSGGASISLDFTFPNSVDTSGITDANVKTAALNALQKLTGFYYLLPCFFFFFFLFFAYVSVWVLM